MTLHEKLAIIVQSVELEKQGKPDEALRLRKTAPIEPWLAKTMKEKVGENYLRQSGWNLSAAEEAYGKDWLSR